MTKEHIGLGVCALLAAGLLAWNIKLQSDIRSLQATVSAAPEVASMQTEDGHNTRAAAKRGPERRRRARPASSDGIASNDDFEGHPLVEVAASEEGQREGRRRRGRMDWDQIRSEMETHTVEIVEAMAATHKWESRVADDVITILLDASDEVGQLWSDAHSDEGEVRSRYQIHKEMDEIRAEAEDEITEMVGADAYEVLAEEIYEARHATFRRSHDG